VKRALVLALLLLTTACARSSARTAATAPTTGPPVASTSSAASVQPSATSSPTKPAAPGDVDGDGAADGVMVTATEVTVALSGGGRVSAPIADSDLPKPAVSGLADLDRDGRNEVWLETARGASTSFVQAYRYDGAALRELTYDGGHIRFGIGGSVTHGDGFTCTDNGSLVVSTAESDDGSTYRVRRRTFRVSGATLVLALETVATTTSRDDARVRSAYQVDCGSVGESD
jgi:hypothetical protein